MSGPDSAVSEVLLLELAIAQRGQGSPTRVRLLKRLEVKASLHGKHHAIGGEHRKPGQTCVQAWDSNSAPCQERSSGQPCCRPVLPAARLAERQPASRVEPHNKGPVLGIAGNAVGVVTPLKHLHGRG